MNRTLSLALALAWLVGASGPAAAEQSQEQKPLSHWVAALADADRDVRLQAVEALRKLGPESQQALPALSKALSDEDPDVRVAAAEAIGAMGPPAKSAVPAMIEALKTEGYAASDRPAWYDIGVALGGIGPEAVPDLIAALDHENFLVCLGAVAALYEIGPEARAAVPKLMELLEKDDPLTRRGVMYGFMGIGPDARAAVPLLIKSLTHEDFHTQYWACRALKRIGPGAKDAVPALIERLQNGVVSVRHNAAAALGGIGPEIGEEGVSALAKALEDPLEPVREDAAIALGTLGPSAQSAAPALRNVLANRRITARVPAAKSLWLITGDTETTVPAIAGELDDFNWCFDAVEALGEIGPAANAAVPAMVALWKSEQTDPELRQATAEALKQIDPQALKASP